MLSQEDNSRIPSSMAFKWGVTTGAGSRIATTFTQMGVATVKASRLATGTFQTDSLCTLLAFLIKTSASKLKFADIAKKVECLEECTNNMRVAV